MFSGLPPTADIGERDWHVSVGPSADSCSAAKSSVTPHLIGAGEQQPGPGPSAIPQNFP
jgi:hypothetical protein